MKEECELDRLRAEVAALARALAEAREALKNRCPCWAGTKENQEGHCRPDCHQVKALTTPAPPQQEG